MNKIQTKVYAIVQARMGSTRLPGKVMKMIVGKPMLQLMIERLKSCKELDGIIIATTHNDVDQPIVDLVKYFWQSSSKGDSIKKFYITEKRAFN